MNRSGNFTLIKWYNALVWKYIALPKCMLKWKSSSLSCSNFDASKLEWDKNSYRISYCIYLLQGCYQLFNSIWFPPCHTMGTHLIPTFKNDWGVCVRSTTASFLSLFEFTTIVHVFNCHLDNLHVSLFHSDSNVQRELQDNLLCNWKVDT